MRRLWPFTRSAVSARSSGVDASIRTTVSIFLQMSTAMMSAPSDANRTACARPCPRAAPVMNATLPSTRPAMSFQSFGGCRVDRYSGNEGGHGFPAADRRRLGRLCVRPVDLPRRETLEDLLERDAAFQTGERVAHTEVRARTECHVRVLLSVD